MKRAIIAAAVAQFTHNAAFAANAACETKSTEQKLAGAAKTSFVKKCEKDATAEAHTTCDAQAAEEKLAEAVKTNVTKNYVADAAATK